MTRSIAAILAGIALLTLLTFAIESMTTPWLMRTFPDALPSPEAMHAHAGMKLFILAYSTLCMVVAGFVTAWIARGNAMRAVFGMVAIQIGLTLWAMSVFPGHAPVWAWVAGMASMVPAAWLGARVCGKWRRPVPSR